MRIKTCLALALAGAFSISAAVATTMQAMSLQQLAKAASVAVVGEVTAARTAKTGDGVFTIYTLDIKESLWGADNKRSVEVAIEGGSQVSGRFKVGYIAPGALTLMGKQQGIFLLSQNNDSNTLSVVGFSQGYFQVVKTAGVDRVLLPTSTTPMALPAAMNEIRQAKAAPASADGIQR